MFHYFLQGRLPRFVLLVRLHRLLLDPLVLQHLLPQPGRLVLLCLSLLGQPVLPDLLLHQYHCYLLSLRVRLVR